MQFIKVKMTDMVKKQELLEALPREMLRILT
jgi:hypothetical protein